jgi:tetratricopeptide (TPR) repeat protein
LKEQGGSNYDAVRELAVQAGEIGMFEESIDLWQQALALRPDTVEALFNLAYNYIHVRSYQEALNASKRAVELSPKTKDAVLNYALSEMLMGNVLKTKTLLEKFASDENETPALMAMLGATYFISGDNDHGLAVFQKLAAKQFRIITYVNSLLEQLIASGQIEYFNRLIDAAILGNMTDRETLRRQVAPLLNKLAGQLHDQGKKDEALSILKSTIATGIDDQETTSLYDSLMGS